MRLLLATLLALSSATPAFAASVGNEPAVQNIFEQAFGSLSPAQPAPTLPPPPPSAPGTLAPGQDDESQLPADEQRTNFSYGEITNRLKKLVIGRGKKRMAARKVNGVTVADRVNAGGIQYIVVHSAMGSCEGAISQMTTHHAAAHFMVCKDGSVTRLVDIKNITLHVKNQAVNDASVGIETETGSTVMRTVVVKKRKVRRAVSVFTEADWDPATRWRMYASLAWLIRAVAEEAHVARDWGASASGLTPGIFGHLDADKGIPDGHTDPGPIFYEHAYPDFETRFPGQQMTPQKFLMLLVKADQSPKVTKISRPDGVFIRVADAARAGISRVELYRVGDPSGKPVQAFAAAESGMPADVIQLSAPTDPGAYRIEAYDLVRNRTGAILKIDPPGASGAVVDTAEVRLPTIPTPADSAP